MALDRLAAAPDLELLLRADALATEIDRHVDEGASRAAMAWLRERVATALAAALPEDLDDLAPEPPADADAATLERIAAAAEMMPALHAAVTAAENRLREAIGGTRAEQRDAFSALTLAQDELDAVRSELRDALDPAATSDVVPAPELPACEPVTEEERPAPEPHCIEEEVVEPAAAMHPEPLVAAAEPAVADELPPLVDAADPWPDAAEPVAVAAPAMGWNGWIGTALAADRVGLGLSPRDRARSGRWRGQGGDPRRGAGRGAARPRDPQRL